MISLKTGAFPNTASFQLPSLHQSRSNLREVLTIPITFESSIKATLFIVLSVVMKPRNSSSDILLLLLIEQRCPIGKGKKPV